MKNSKNVKGFTLIELIVVIAIIGVLAAILVPTMLGYVTKSKCSSANAAAKNLQNAVNTALIDADAEGVTVADQTTGVVPSSITTKVEQYFEDIDECDSTDVSISGMVCNGVAVKMGSYWGSAPLPTTVDDGATGSEISGYTKATSITAASAIRTGSAT